MTFGEAWIPCDSCLATCFTNDGLSLIDEVSECGTGVVAVDAVDFVGECEDSTLSSGGFFSYSVDVF